MTVATHTYPLPRPFFVLATQNPIEQEGTYPLPEAQLDRFLFKLNVGFPSAEEMEEILARTTGGENVAVTAVADGDQIIAMQQLARQVPLPTSVSRAISQLVVATHPENSPSDLVRRFVRYGASPRGGQAMVLGGKILALLNGRYNVSLDDICATASSSTLKAKPKASPPTHSLPICLKL